MNKLILFLALFLLSGLSSLVAQEAYKGQLYITGHSFSLADHQLNVLMDVNYEGMLLPTDRAVTLTPVLRSGNYSLPLPSVLINGAEMHRAYRHSQASADSIRSSGKASPSLVIADNRKASRHFSYKTSVDYQQWMNDAVLFLCTEEIGHKGIITGAFEDKVTEIPSLDNQVEALIDNIDTQVLSLVNIVPPSNEVFVSEGEFLISEHLAGNPRKNNRRERAGYDDIYRLLNSEVGKVLNQPGTELSYIQLTGYGYPIGDYQRNGRIAALRSVELKEMLQDYRLSGKAPLEVSWVSEDWDSIANLIRQSNMQFRESVLNIIETVSVTRGRENMLMTFADGIPYRYLCGEVFPRIPRLAYKISYTRSVSMPSSVNSAGAGTYISLESFYQMAMQAPVGSANYNDMLDLCARLYPNSPEANINAAAVALTKRDATKARAYLAPFSEHPQAFNNMGLLYLLEGNRDKAEIYLRMAAANGVEQAKQALNALMKREINP